jgi:hypothetical protein
MRFEESVNDLALNVKSLGFDLEKLKENNELRIFHTRQKIKPFK